MLGNDTDPAGLAISLNTVTSGTGGSVSLSGTTVTFTPTANYTGPASFTYTIKNSAGLISSPATVSITVNAPAAPVANNDSGFVVTENLALAIAASALLGNDTDPAGLAISLNTVTSGTGGGVSLSGTTVTFTPSANYTGAASFTYTIKNSAGLISAPATVSLTVVAPGTSSSLFSPTDTPATVTVNDHGAVELGVKFTSSVAGKITGIRFYKGPQNLGTHIGNLWNTGGTRLGTATFSGETASGWQQVNFATPVAILANTTYVVSYYAPLGLYSANGNYFANAHVNGTLTASANAGVAGGNGVYAYSAASKFPNSTFNATNYWVDVVFTSP